MNQPNSHGNNNQHITRRDHTINSIFFMSHNKKMLSKEEFFVDQLKKNISCITIFLSFSETIIRVSYMNGKFYNLKSESSVLINKFVCIDCRVRCERDLLECVKFEALITIVRVGNSDTIEDIGYQLCSPKYDLSHQRYIGRLSTRDKP